ncbi:S8 family serine peptidase [Algihabitans albus]|uniref:S8 family serine peptidase n=1 Tax=Algihabitans albus TaxID=2164067 RepID=UPI001ABC2F7A|nr:S8 family serine peptidase [Algihabitans albus]
MSDGASGEVQVDVLLDRQRPVPTGGLVVIFKEGAETVAQIGALEAGGLRASSLSAIADLTDFMATEREVCAVLTELGVAFVPECAPDRARDLIGLLANQAAVADTRPEFYLFATAPFQDTEERTWGVAATGAFDSRFTGEGIKVAVLDTGLDLQHPDYSGRSVVNRSFVPGEEADDLQGHGTHCAGTAAGRPADPQALRYGVAPQAELYIGKVLDNRGAGRERDILAGMAWAVGEGCEVVSMSLGAAVRRGETYNMLYEREAQAALRSGSLIVAAAGNESARGAGYIAPVGMPANSPSILAVAALDQALDVAEFSSGGINGDGGEIDLAAPGVGVFSSLPLPQTYGSLRGTSMACPHVAGCAALWAQSDPALRGRALWDRLLSSAAALSAAERDVGRGLVQAPIEAQPALS